MPYYGVMPCKSNATNMQSNKSVEEGRLMNLNLNLKIDGSLKMD